MKLLITSILLLPFLQSIANGGNLNNEAEKTIKHSINIPGDLVKENKKVEILFSADSQGKVNFVLAKTEDTELKNSIEKQFSKLSFSKINNDVINSVILNFKKN